MVAIPNSVNWDYIAERVRRYNERPSDDLLFRIGSHADILTTEDCGSIASQDLQDGTLIPEQRYRVLDWICRNGFQIECDLALLIFGREQLTNWLERSRQVYPDFEFYLPFEYQDSEQSGWESGINFSVYWKPNSGAPEPDVECDFPGELYWESAEMFWGEWMSEGNHFGLILDSYPSQRDFATPGSFCVDATLTGEEADLMSVAQVLEHFTA